MKKYTGTIIRYDEKVQSGFISCSDMNVYRFFLSDWKQGKYPKVGTIVKFTRRDGKAIDVEVLWLCP